MVNNKRYGNTSIVKIVYHNKNEIAIAKIKKIKNVKIFLIFAQ